MKRCIFDDEDENDLSVVDKQLHYDYYDLVRRLHDKDPVVTRKLLELFEDMVTRDDLSANMFKVFVLQKLTDKDLSDYD